MYFDVIMAGAGGQGILMIGDLLALTAMREERQVTWMPAYGVEMRGGTANCTVVVSDEPIGSPITAHPYHAIIMNRPSIQKYMPTVRPGGVMLVNGTFVPPEDVTRTDLDVIMIPTAELAREIGDGRLASMIALGAFVERTGIVKPEGLIGALKETLPAKRHHLLPMNEQAIERGRAFARNGS